MGSRSSTHATLEVQKEEQRNLRRRNKRLKNESKREKKKKDYNKEVHDLAVNKELSLVKEAFSPEEVETKLKKVGGELTTARVNILETLKLNKNQLYSYIQSLEALKNELQIVIMKYHTESDQKKILFEEEFLNTFQRLEKRNELLLTVQSNIGGPTRSAKHQEESDNSLKTFKENKKMRKSAIFNLMLNTAIENHLREAEMKFQHFTDELKNLKNNVGQISEVSADIYLQKTCLIEKMDNTIELLNQFSTNDLESEGLPAVETNEEEASKEELSQIENKLEIVKSQLSQFIEEHCEIDEILMGSVQKFEGFKSIKLLEEEKAALVQQISKLKGVVKDMMKLIEIVQDIEEDML